MPRQARLDAPEPFIMLSTEGLKSAGLSMMRRTGNTSSNDWEEWVYEIPLEEISRKYGERWGLERMDYTLIEEIARQQE